MLLNDTFLEKDQITKQSVSTQTQNDLKQKLNLINDYLLFDKVGQNQERREKHADEHAVF